jgi:nitrogen fixation protein NifU and related proteins
MSFIDLFLPLLAIFLVAVAWFILHYYANPVIENPDGIAKVTGNCGDTMEIGLRFQEDRVLKTHCWTNGCSVSKSCIETAAMLAKNKTVFELRNINMTTIMDVSGQLPETHLHCAQLAEITLHRAVEDYLSRQGHRVNNDRQIARQG